MGGMRIFSAAAVLGFATTQAALSTYTPIDSGPTYSVGIPSSSQISGSNTGAIYFSLKAPDTYRWVGLGIGGQMRGAEIFVMYQDGQGNVTISARAGGQGHVQPLLDDSLMAGVELLGGSGVSGGFMTANVRCTTCTLASSDKQSSPWIAAWHTGSSLASTSTSATITQHNDDAYRQFTFDLSSASLSTDTNPFVGAAGSTTPSGTNTASGSSPSGSSGDDDGDSGDDHGGKGGNGGNTGSTPANSGSSTVGGGASTAKTIATYQKAHGIIMGVTVVLLFPLGAIFMRLVGSPLFHGLLQIFALAMLIVGFGLGVKLAQIRDLLYKSAGRNHTICGTVILGLFLIQPFLGLIHHTFYKKHNSRTAVSHTHIWFGRIIMILAVINGGLGLKLAANTKGGEIAYGVVAGVVAVVYAVVVVLRRKGTETKWDVRGKREKVSSREGSS